MSFLACCSNACQAGVELISGVDMAEGEEREKQVWR